MRSGHLATDVKVTVAASPRKGLEATLELSERLAAAGYPVVPHLFTFNEVGSTERWRRRTLSRLTHR
jgi:methylenetetrahydrofolate reductase (NADPH)